MFRRFFYFFLFFFCFIKSSISILEDHRSFDLLKHYSICGFAFAFGYNSFNFVFNKISCLIKKYINNTKILLNDEQFIEHIIHQNMSKENSSLITEASNIAENLNKNNLDIFEDISEKRFLPVSSLNMEIQWNAVPLPEAVKNDLLYHAKLVFSSDDKESILLPNIFFLYGLPGTSKTEIIKGLAHELNIPLLIIDPNLLSENIYNKISIDSVLEHINNKGPYIIHIKNIERMNKNFLYSLVKYAKMGLNIPNVLLTFSCNNDLFIKDFTLNKNQYIKFIIIDTPKMEERLNLIKHILSLYESIINVNNIDVHYIANILSGCKQKDIYFVIERAIERKILYYNIKKYKKNEEENSNELFENFEYVEKKEFFLNNIDILSEYKLFKKQDAIVNGNNLVHINTGLTHVNEFLIENPKIYFDQVIGLDHIKKELYFITEYLKNPDIYKKIKIRMPKGILFKGPPGCGKTLMARAIAGEAGVTVISINGSDFIYKYVGEGANKVRELFEIAKIYGPTIIFIDEIDAIGGKRSSNADGGEKEYTQTLNALLTEMDGFLENSNVIVIASTNRNIDDLDQALMRRFEEKYNFPLPNYKERLKILELYLKNVNLSFDLSLESIAMKTNNFSGAKLEYLVNQAKYNAIDRINKLKGSLADFEVTREDLIQAYNTMSIGYEILNSSISMKEFFKTAVHESGHTLCMLLQENYPKEFELVTIIPRDIGNGTVLGFAQHFSKEEFKCLSKENLKQLITVSLGGMVAEELIFNQSYDGVSSDLEYASFLAKLMVTKYGMADDLLYSSDDNKNLSDEEKAAVESILRECKKKCKELLKNNEALLKDLAKALLIQKTLNREQVIEIIKNHTIEKIDCEIIL